MSTLIFSDITSEIRNVTMFVTVDL